MKNDKMVRFLKNIMVLIAVLPLLGSCIREDEVANSPQGNFEALWKIIDEQYCFLEYKQIDWDAIHDEYSRLITGSMSSEGLFEVLGNMLNELQERTCKLSFRPQCFVLRCLVSDYPQQLPRRHCGRLLSGQGEYRLPHCRRYQVQDIRRQHRLYALREFLFGHRQRKPG